MTATYAAATTLEEALAAVGAGARPIAGGTDLVVGARQGKTPLPDALIAIHELGELRGITEQAGGGLRIGALVSHADLVEHPGVRERFTALADASAIVGSHATRHVGTIGGNVMNASPAMETGGPLMCFAAAAVLVSADGERRLPLEELLTGPGRTAARPDELLVAIELPGPPAGSGSCYARLEYRRQMEIAVVGATCAVTVAGSQVTAARVAITALAPTILRVPAAEAALVGSDGGADAIRAAGAAAAAAASPISDVRASSDYRLAMAAVIGRRTVAAAIARARGHGESVPIPASPALHGASE
jgi:CO/xanthine dehydrogenase FAD-binding subunit